MILANAYIKVNVPIVSIALSQLCDCMVSAHLCLHRPEPAVSHSSVTPRPHTTITLPAFKLVPDYTAW